MSSTNNGGASGRWWCHACGAEVAIIRAPEPTCSRCRETFVEEIEEDTNDDPRDFDEPPFAFIPPPPLQGAAAAANPFAAFGVAGRGGGAQGQFRFITTGPNGQQRVFEFGRPNNGGGQGGNEGGGGGMMALLRALGGAVGAGTGRNGENQQGGQAPNRRAGQAAAERRNEDPGDPEDGELPAGEANERRARAANGQSNQAEVPLRNLADFLGEAFGARTPHAADDPRNNPFAEGGEERDHENEAEQNQPRQAGVLGDGSPFDYLLQLLNSFGGGGIGPLAGNPGDYAWGEESFQNLLNDLMAQASGRAGPQPAPQEMIDGLPRVTVTQALIDDPNSHFQDCTICQENSTVGEKFLSLPCKHAFHDECVVPWLKQSGTCPTCRYQLVPQPVDGRLPGDDDENGQAQEVRSHHEDDDDDENEPEDLPGGWPEVERSRSASRAAARERARQEERNRVPEIDDLD